MNSQHCIVVVIVPPVGFISQDAMKIGGDMKLDLRLCHLHACLFVNI